MGNILHPGTQPVVKEERTSLVDDALYNSNTLYAGWVNNFGENPRLRYDEQAARQDVLNGHTFSFSNPDVQERLKQLPQGVVDALGTPSSYQEFEAVIARATKAHEGIARLTKELGTIGTFAAMVPGAVADWDSLLPVGLIGKTKKALDLAEVSSKATRAAAYAVSGGAEAYVSDAVYQHVMRTSDDTEAFMSIVGGSVLSPIMAKYLLDGSANSKLTVEDPVFGPREPTMAEKEALHVKDSELKTNRDLKELEALKAKREELLAPTKDESGKVVTKLDTFKKEIAELTTKKKELEAHFKAKASEAKVHKEKEAIVTYKQKQQELKEVKTVLNSKEKELTSVSKQIDKVQKKLEASIETKTIKEAKKLEDTLKTLTTKHKELQTEVSKVKEQHKNIERETKQARSKITTKSMKKTLETPSKPEAHKEAKVVEDALKNVNKKLKETSKKLEISKRLVGSTDEKIGNLKAKVETKTSEIAREVEEFKNGPALERIEEAGKGKLKLKWLEEHLIWSPISRMYSSDNQMLRGIATKLYAPYKALKDSAGNIMPIRPNASFDKFVVENEWSKVQAVLLQEFNEAVKKGEFNGKVKDFMSEIRNHYIKKNSEFARKQLANLGTNHIDEKALEAEIHNLLNKGSVSYAIEGKEHLGNAAQHIADYYKTIAKYGKESGVKGFEDVVMNGYLPRAFDAEAIEQLGTKRAVDILSQAIANHPANQRMLDNPSEIREYAEGIIKKVGKRNTLAQMIDRAGGDQAMLSNQKARTLKVYDDDIIELIHSDIAEITASYSYTISGRIALQRHLGMSTPKEINDFYDKLVVDYNLKQDELNDVKATIDTILGTREIMKNPDALGNKAMRILTKLNSIIYGPGFALTATSEIANVIATTGFKALNGTHFDSIKSAFEMARGDKVSAEWVNELQASGLIGEIVAGRHLQRFDAADNISSAGLLEKHLDLGRNFVMHKMGLAHVTEATRAVALGAGFNYITSLARKTTLTEVEQARLARIGLSQEALESIRHLVDTGVIKYDGDKLKRFGFDGWDLELQREVQAALFNHMESTVLHPNGATLPLFASDPNSPIAKIMLQFMRFPMAMHEQLAMRGFSEADANTAIGLISNLMLFTLVAQAKDLGKDDIDRRYNLNTEEGRTNAIMYVFSNNFMSGSIVTAADSMYSVISGKQLHSAYSQGTGSFLGVSNATLGSVQRATSKAMDGELMDAFTTLQNPLWHLPVFSNYLKTILKDD